MWCCVSEQHSLANVVEVALHTFLCRVQCVCQHLALHGQVLNTEGNHQVLDAVTTKHPEGGGGGGVWWFGGEGG